MTHCWRVHTCQPSVIRTETPSFWHRWKPPSRRRKPPSRRRKSPSFDCHLDINNIAYNYGHQEWKLKGIFAPFRHFVSPLDAQRGLWLATTCDHPSFTHAHSRPSFQTMAMPTWKLDVSQTYVSPKIQKKLAASLFDNGGTHWRDEIWCHTATPHQSNNIQREQDIVLSWHWLPCQVPSVKKSSDGTHASLHNPNCSLLACPKSNSEL